MKINSGDKKKVDNFITELSKATISVVMQAEEELGNKLKFNFTGTLDDNRVFSMSITEENE